jgi:hypothetical protein
MNTIRTRHVNVAHSISTKILQQVIALQSVINAPLGATKQVYVHHASLEMVFQSMVSAILSVFAIKQQEIMEAVPLQLKKILMILVLNINILILKENSSKCSIEDAEKFVLSALMAITLIKIINASNFQPAV